MASEEEIYATLTAVVRDVLMRDDVVLRPETTASDVPGWDSMAHIMIVVGVEQRLAIQFGTKELEAIGSANVGDLVRIIDAKIGGK